MRKHFTILMTFLLLAGVAFAQKPQRISTTPADGYAPAGTVFTNQSPNTDVMGLWALPSTGGTSGFTRIPGNTYNYQRTEYLITPAEMAACGFPSGVTIDAIGYLIYQAGGTTQTGSLKIYLMNTNDATYQLGASWTTTGFTMVSNIASWTVPIAAGSYVINFSGGTPFTYTGGGVYVAWEFSNRNAVGTTALVALCNLNLTGGLMGQRSTTALPTTLAASTWRPATMFFNNSLTDILQVTNIYAQEKTPVPSGVPSPISARVINTGTAAESFTATLTVKNQANVVRYTTTQTVTGLAGGAAALVSFAPWTTTIMENVTFTVDVTAGAGETFMTNNTMTIPVNVNTNLFGYCYAFNPATGYGTGAPGGIFASRFFMHGTGTVPSANLGIYGYATNIGQTISAVVINSAGAIVAQSADHVLTEGDMNTYINLTFPTPPSFTNEDFFVGLLQPASAGDSWYPMACMVDAPYRAETFFFFSLGDPTPYLLDDDYKYLIEAVVTNAGPTVPTLSEWFLILLGGALLAVGTIFILKRR